MDNNKIYNFTDLKAWQVGHTVVLDVYRITKSFPKEELFGIVSQIRRAAVSITSNIAEGFCRTSGKEKSRFYIIALGSVTEVQNQLLIAKDLTYAQDQEYTKVFDNLKQVHKMLNGLIKSARTRISPLC